MAKSVDNSFSRGKICKGVGTLSKGPASPNVGERLHSQVHVCNHARCAANKPDYAVKAATPAKKFLVAKKHAYGGLEEKAKHTSCDHDRSHVLMDPMTRNGKRSSPIRSYNVGRNGMEDQPSSIPQHSRSGDSSEKTGAERRGIATTGRRSNVTEDVVSTTSSASMQNRQQQRSRLGSSGFIVSPTVEHGTEWNVSPSRESSISAVSISQISTKREHEEEEEEHHYAAADAQASPTASVGSNDGTAISSLEENFMVAEDVMCELSLVSASTASNLQFPGSESLALQAIAAIEEVSYNSLIAPISAGPTISQSPPPSASSTAPRPSPGSASITSKRSCLASPESVVSRPAAPGSRTPPKLSPGSASLTSERSSLTTPPSVASKLARRFITNLKESSRVGLKESSNTGSTMSSSGASAKKPSRNTKSSVSPAPADSLPTSTASRIARKFISDLQASTTARRAANSTKGVRSIELRGGRAQSYMTTTITSWNMTTTTVEAPLSLSAKFSEKRVDSENSRPMPTASAKPPWKSSTKETPFRTATNTKEDPKVLKFGKKTKTSVPEEVKDESETVSLKHGEIAERRLSEEWMTNHALEGVVKNLADKDHRVKLLVHAFESLASLSDSEGHCNDDSSLKTHLEYESLSAAPIAV